MNQVTVFYCRCSVCSFDIKVRAARLNIQGESVVGNGPFCRAVRCLKLVFARGVVNSLGIKKRHILAVTLASNMASNVCIKYSAPRMANAAQ